MITELLTCVRCVHYFEYPFRPGAKPRYCSDECRKEAARERRIQRARDRANERRTRIIEDMTVND
ncbi:hypothetical protein PV682_38330 [Streptomyces niveiscabiei]|uniref:hypothetical protein n=1 Tax=Streptomyces niveiscabiei TaxID=164115 RepID=UPI00299FDD54|nr:hypothetical protein [Streptomyces niveiscabiei]MDX3387260.1 hypothetical protein [Streptomyces niveiscabiei]